MGAMMAEYQPSLAISRPKIHAVTLCTRMATGSATYDSIFTLRSSPRRSQMMSSTLMTRYVVMTHMSHASGLVKFKWINMFQMRWMPPRSIRMNAPAHRMHTVEVMTAGMDTRLNDSMPNTCAELATIRPPADRPTKNMKHVMYRPHDTPLDMPVTHRPCVSWNR